MSDAVTAASSERFSPLDAAALMTLLVFLLAPIGNWSVRPTTVALAAFLLLVPALRHRPALWGALAFLSALRVVLDWPMSDNHSYLLAIWCGTIGWALRSREPAAQLASNARWIVAWVFALATIQKAASIDYLDGTFFRVWFLTDARFEDLARLLGVELDAIDRARDLLDPPPPPVPGADPPPAHGIETPARFDAMARFATGWTIAIEALVALAFIVPRGRVGVWRDASLLVFIVTTYAIATVEGFGWLLVAMGLAQAPADASRVRAAYVAGAVGLLFYREVPWMSWLAAWFAPVS